MTNKGLRMKKKSHFLEIILIIFLAITNQYKQKQVFLEIMMKPISSKIQNKKRVLDYLIHHF